MTRTFEDSPAIRRAVNEQIGLTGASGSGKTCSSLRIATGMQRITGGDIFGIDTEANRMLAYADQFRFRHVPFTSPFDAMSYLAAVEHCVKKGAKIIIIDSASHLHEGPGGTLEMHEAECERLMKAWNQPRDKVQMSAWQRPKSELRRFLNTILQMPVNTIWNFRAKEKLKIIPGKQPQHLGFMPIAGDEMIYEMTLNCLLYPNSGGIPSWHPEEMGERAIIKLPQQFKELFKESRPLDEDIGQKLAEWAAGGKPADTVIDIPILTAAYAACQSADQFAKLEDQRKSVWGKIPPGDPKTQLKATSDAAKARIAAEGKL